MSQPFRVDGLCSVDRSRPLGFTFDGVAYQGYAGDTLASALIANGVHLVGRSYKYHRPRGILSAGAEEPNALVSLSRGPGRFTPNLRATQIELYEGLKASSQNCWPSLTFDVGAVCRRLLLQDVHGSEPLRQELGLDACLRARDPPRGGSRGRSSRAGSR